MALFIIIGVSGSGKSSLAKTMANCICEADSYPNLYKDGILVTSKLSAAHQACIERVEQFMMARMDIVQSNTNLDLRSIKPYIELAKQYTYTVHLILPKHDLLHYTLTDMSRAAQIAALVNVRSQGDKRVPFNVIQSMISQYDTVYPIFSKMASETDPVKLLATLATFEKSGVKKQ
jgi:ABC-type iron transport system FetAB ATPase subunit